MGHPTVYPTGVTIYDKDAACNGYTVYPSAKGAILIDMNGREVHVWQGLIGKPNKVLPGGFVLGSSGSRDPLHHPFDNFDLVQLDWDGNTVWKFDHTEEVAEATGKRWAARQNHDYQREGSSTGYFAPGTTPKTSSGNTLLIVNREVTNSAVSGKALLDNAIIEVDWEGALRWEWRASDHFEELGFDEAAKNTIYRLPSDELARGGHGYWLAINSVSTLGPNPSYDAGDERFHPDNIIWSARNANILAIIERKSGAIVWRLGPDFSKAPFGWLIGPHHAHLIPRGLPGEGNLLVFDNGGWAGYGAPRDVSGDGTGNQLRDFSRVLEFDPCSLTVAWQYTSREAGHIHPLDSYKFYSPFASSAQRLPNGNTLITEGVNGRLFEVTPEHRTVWEYVNPHSGVDHEGLAENRVYRAYRVPYEWVPQLPRPTESAVPPLNVSKFRVPGAPLGVGGKVTVIEGIKPTHQKVVDDPLTAALNVASKEPSNFCVLNSGNDK